MFRQKYDMVLNDGRLAIPVIFFSKQLERVGGGDRRSQRIAARFWDLKHLSKYATILMNFIASRHDDDRQAILIAKLLYGTPHNNLQVRWFLALFVLSTPREKE
jgi:hypothetical protein